MVYRILFSTMIKSCLLLALLCAVARSKGTQYVSKEWDFIQFAQNWPISECIQWKQKYANRECNLATSSQWTIHGIWPTKRGTKGPGFCNKDLTFDVLQIKSIVDELSHRWLSVHKGNDADISFWKHEWEKHGTCSTSLNSLDSELKYFTQGLNWNKQYNLTSYLEQIGLTPGGDPQTINNIYSNLQSAIGSNPIISCRKSSGTFYLLDIKICFDKSLSLIDCESVKKSKYKLPLTHGCPDNTPIHYPDLSIFNYSDKNNKDSLKLIPHPKSQ